jgi:enoyl-CoA hydratase
MLETIAVATEDHVATVTLLRPTMPPAFFGELEGAFRALADDASLRAIVVRAAGKAFSYGLDLPAAFQELGQYFAGGGAATRMELFALIRRLQGAFNAIAASPVPVVAAIHGHCIGGGLDLAAACDVRLCSADARFSLRETKIAIVADLGSLQRLPAIIGEGRTRELAFTGKDIDAERARAIGLVNDVLADRAALDAAALAMAREIAANPPLTVRGVKQVLDHGMAKPAADGLAYVAAWNSAFLASEDLGEALAAFVEKRAPSYKGK